MPPRVVATGADFAYQNEPGRVRVERLQDELVDHVGPVVLGCVDVVDPGLNGLPEQLDRIVGVRWRPEHARPGQPHGSETDRSHVVGAECSVRYRMRQLWSHLLRIRSHACLLRKMEATFRRGGLDSVLCVWSASDQHHRDRRRRTR
jgi:hypothetical protein